MPGNEEVIGGKWTIDITDIKAGLTEANRLIKISDTEFKAAAAGMGDWTKSADGLAAKQKQLSTNIEIQQEKVRALTEEYNRVAKEKGENSAAAQNLLIKLNNETAALNKSKTELDKNTKALEEFGNEEDEAEQKTGKLGNAIKSIATGAGKAVTAAMKSLAVAVTAVGAAMAAAAESTREYRADLGQLQVNAQNANADFDAMKNKLAEVGAVTGETDAAFEGMNMLLATGLDTANIEIAADTLTGAALKFDGLKFEGLSEGLQETLATGAAVGPMAEMLERSGVNLEKFNNGLARCKTEAAQQDYIMQALASTGLADVNAAYQEANASIIQAQKAQFVWNDAMAKMGAVAEPIMSSMKLGLGEVVSGFASMLQGSEDAYENFYTGLADFVYSIVEQAQTLLPKISDVLTTAIPVLIDAVTTMLPELVSAAADIILQIVDALLAALPELVDVGIQIIINLINGLTKMIPKLLTSITQVLLKIVRVLIDNIPTLLDAAVQFFMAIVNAIPQIITALIEALPGIVQAIIDTLLASIPILIDAAIQLLMAIVNAIPTIIDALVKALPQIINALIDGLISALPLLLEGAIQLLMAIVDAIPVIIEALIAALPTIITALIDGLIGAIPMLLEGAIQFMMAIVDAIPKIIPELIKALPTIISAIINGLLKSIPQVIQGAIQLFMGIIKAIPQIVAELIKNMPQIIQAIVSGIGAGMNEVIKIGGDLLKGVWQGIKDAGKWLWDKISGFFDGIWDGLKKMFGIHSPSRLMADTIGKPMAQGVGVGFQKAYKSVKRDIENSMKIDPIDPDDDFPYGGMPRGGSGGIGRRDGGLTFVQNNYSPKALSRYEIYRQTKNAAALLGR